MPSKVLRDCLDERRKHKGQVIARRETVPESTRNERSETSAETWFLSLGCDAEVDVIAQPVVGVFVPVFEIGAAVLSRFDAPGVDVVEFVPLNAAGGGGYAVVAEAREDAAAFGEGPDGVVFEACGDAEGVE